MAMSTSPESLSGGPPTEPDAVTEATEPFDTEPVEDITEGEFHLERPDEPDETRLFRLREKARELPTTPGVYLMKDCRDRVIYVGKSRCLRDRVGSYFVRSADLGGAKQALLDYVLNFEVLFSANEVEALLTEARLIKDIRPRFNVRLTDGKSYPFIEITTRDDFPGVFVTRAPQTHGTRLFGPFIQSGHLYHAMTILQKAFKFRTCTLEISAEDPKRRFFRPCLLHAIKQCTAPCGDRITQEAYKADIQRLMRFMDSQQSEVIRELNKEMQDAAVNLNYERAAELRDQIKALQSLNQRPSNSREWQPEVFVRDHTHGLRQLQEVLDARTEIRSIECIDIAHLQGEATVGALVSFVDGKPFKDGYRRYRIKTVTGIDDFASIREVVARRYREAGQGNELFPDLIVIDGGLGQLHAAQEAFAGMEQQPRMIISLAKQEEEIYQPGLPAPLRLSRTNAALKLLQHIRDETHRFGQSYHHLLIHRNRLEHETKAGTRPPTRKRKPKPPTPPVT